MRITSEMMVTSSLQRLSARLQQYERTQSQLATGRRILNVSDDPSGAGRALALRAAQRSREQQLRNAADARSWLDLADSNLQSAVERLQRANELAVRGANPISDEERAAMAEEVRAIQAELVEIANARQRGRPLFAGYHDGDAVDKVDGEWVYLGGHDPVTRRVGDRDAVQINVTAHDAFGFAGAAGGDVFTVLDNLAEALTDGDTEAIAAALDQVGGALRTVGKAQAQIGAHTNRVESAVGRTGDALHALRTQLAEVEDVDLAEAVMDLQVQEVAYQATLAALARALPPSLAAFLR